MPVWSVRLERAAFVWLITGFAAGALLLAAKGLGWGIPWSHWLPLHTEALLVGWMLQFTMGVAYWMLPKHASGPERGPDGAIGAAFVLLNTGVLLALAGQIHHQGALAAVGRLLELLAAAAFGSNAWPRVKPFGA